MKLTRIIILAVALLLSSNVTVSAEKTKSKKIKKVDICITNLKQIGLGMHMYANDKKWFFPSGDNIIGLKKLINEHYLRNPKLFICPDDKKRKTGDINNLTENNSSYIYFDIERSFCKVRRPSQTILAFDKPGNHKGFVNALYVDGHVMKIKTSKNHSCEAILKVIYKDDFSDSIRKLQLKKAKEMDKKWLKKAKEIKNKKEQEYENIAGTEINA